MADRSVLRFSTAGSVDDGKSTLIGRLLFDAKSILEDQLSNLARVTARRGGVGGNTDSDMELDLALLTDGLIAEREQGITIDVAYRYFSTPERKFIIADTPGHEQYTRNMVTGASTADLTIILVDAKKGLSTQSLRHALVASLLGIRHIVVAINKMDLVDWSLERFSEIRGHLEALRGRLQLPELHVLPLSALLGDMVVSRGAHLDWYKGPTLLEILEAAGLDGDDGEALRFPVQLVSRPGIPGAYARGYMGRIEAGKVARGDRVVVEPGGLVTRVRDILTFEGSLTDASAPQSVTLILEDELDVSRGDLIAHEHARQRVAHQCTAMVCWMDREALDPNRKYLLQQNSRVAKVRVSSIDYVLDIASLAPEGRSTTLQMNDIGQVVLQSREALLLDDYASHRGTGGFILIDETNNHTVAAGMVVSRDPEHVA